MINILLIFMLHTTQDYHYNILLTYGFVGTQNPIFIIYLTHSKDFFVFEHIHMNTNTINIVSPNIQDKQ